MYRRRPTNYNIVICSTLIVGMLVSEGHSTLCIYVPVADSGPVCPAVFSRIAQDQYYIIVE